jgi:hypothetical protein
MRAADTGNDPTKPGTPFGNLRIQTKGRTGACRLPVSARKKWGCAADRSPLDLTQLVLVVFSRRQTYVRCPSARPRGEGRGSGSAGRWFGYLDLAA